MKRSQVPNKIKSYGLFINEELCFLAANPAEPLEKEGIIEVKCPSSTGK